MSEKRSKIGDFAPPIIFTWIDSPMSALQLCRWQFSQKVTL